METTVVCWGYMGIMEKKMETSPTPESWRLGLLCAVFGLSPKPVDVWKPYTPNPSLYTKCSNNMTVWCQLGGLGVRSGFRLWIVPVFRG